MKRPKAKIYQTLNQKSARLLVLMALFCSASAQAQVGSQFVLPPQSQSLLRGDDDYLTGWMQDSLKGDDAAYQVIRDEINLLGENPKQLAAALPGFEKAARANPRDSKAVFRYVIAMWRNNEHPQYGELRDWMYYAPSPNAYNYDRLRWLMLAYYNLPDDPQFKRLGERLLQRDPNDKFMHYWMQTLRSQSDSLDDKEKNLSYALQQVKVHPKDATAQGNLGGAYRDLWIITKKRSYANLTVGAYKKYLQMADKGASFRKDAQFWIQTIPKDQARWEKQGIGKAR